MQGKLIVLMCALSAALVMTIDDAGQVASLMDKENQVEYGVPGQGSPVLTVYHDGAFHTPRTVSWDEESKQITLQ